MKKILLSLIAVILLHTYTQAQDSWANVVEDGFGLSQNYSIASMCVFNGMLYAATGTNNGNIYRSATGNANTWSNVFANYNSATSLVTTTQGGGNMYVSAAETYSMSVVYRTPDGTNWTPYFTSYSNTIPFVIPFSGSGTTDSMYVVVNNYAGSTLYKSAYDSNDPSHYTSAWTSPLDFNVAQSNIYIYTYCTHNSKLYLGTNDLSALIYYSNDGNTWVADSNFHTANISNISAMISYGGYLYVAADTSGVPAIWRTNNDTAFTFVTSFPSYTGITNFTVANGQLWVALSGNIFGTHGAIMKSSDGLTFTYSNANGFGLENESGNEGNFAIFKNNLYYGDNYNPSSGYKSLNSDGGQIWRYCLGSQTPKVNLGADQILCSNNTVTLDAGTGFTSYLWCSEDTTQTVIASNPGSNPYYVSVCNASGCYSSDTVNINLVALPNAPVLTPDTTICHGNAVTLNAHDSLIDKPALDLMADNAYLKSRDYTALMNNVDESMTIEMWFKANDQGVLVVEEDSTGYLFYDNQLEISSAGVLYGRVQGLPVDTIGTVTFGTWNHVALRYDKSLLKLDGVLNGASPVVSTSGTRIAPWNYGYSQGYNFGAASYNYNPITTSSPFNGLMRDIRIWNYARNDADIALYKDSTIAGNSPGLVANYLCNEGTGNIAHDHSVNGLNDTLKGGSTIGSQFILPPVYSWLPITGLNTATGNTVISTPVATTTYTVSCTNAFGCSNSSSVTVTVPHPQISPVSSSVCLNNSVNYTNTGTVTDSTHWFVSGSFSLSDVSFSYTSLAVGTQNVLLIGFTHSCVDSSSTTLTVNPSPTSIATSGQIVCYGDTVTFVDTISGGTAPFTYLWYNGTNTYTTPVLSVPAVLAGDVSVTAKDINGCVTNASTSLGTIPLTDIYGHITYSGGPVLHASAKLYHYVSHLTHFVLVDSVVVNSTTGMYHFAGVYHSEYLIKVFADTTIYPSLVPTYYGNSYLWTLATHVLHNCSTTDTLDITMVEPAAVAHGAGYLRGRVVEGVGFGAKNIGDPVPGIDIKIGHNPGGQMVTSTTTSPLTSADHGGYYYFTNVDTGSYVIYVDIPGLGRDSSYTFSVTPTNETFLYLDYIVDSALIRIVPNAGVGISNPETAMENKFGIYPNPTKGNTIIEYTTTKDADVNLKVYDVLGNLIKSIVNTRQQEGKYSYTINSDADKLKAGVYFVTLIIDGKSTSQRFVVID